MVTKTDELLKDRGKTNGAYDQNAGAAQAIKQVFYRYPNWHVMTAVQRESLELIATKLGRILAGDPNYADHWDDIAGYAELVSRNIK